MMTNTHQMWIQLSSLMFIVQLIKQFVPRTVYSYLTDPYINISFNEIVTTVNTNSLRLNHAYALLEAYLDPKSSKVAKRIKCELPQEGKKLIFSLDDYEEIVDEFRGIKIWWYLSKKDVNHKYLSERRQLRLKFHRKHRQTIIYDYLDHVLGEGRTITLESRRLKLYSNNPNTGRFQYQPTLWSHGVRV
ncbi:hypothetical protein MKW98_031057 [Papaver atlanticum]|uniref:AAA-type ATPase N-terminal domain-containing protein n=1 Tax=Papaver atlanticum TaxID=357466 RepID=A0AAD4SW99_9MAGN|nr:hypothetical protein MKW98_031057 [Papaver atlanticum]